MTEEIEKLIGRAESDIKRGCFETSIAYSNLAIAKQNKELIDYLYEIDNKLHEIRLNNG